MSDTNIYDLIHDVQDNGIRLVTLIGIYTLYSKERRNYQLNQRDAALFHNLKILMEERGRGSEWRDGPRIGIQIDHLPNFKQLSILLSKAMFTKKSNYPRRKTMNNQNINWFTLVAAIFGAFKLILQPFGIDLSHITDVQVNDMVNGIAAISVVGGIIYNHFKKPISLTSDPNKFIQP